jgi:hypothetical protein
MEKKKKLPKLPYDLDEVLDAFKLKRKHGSEKLSLWLQNPIPIQEKWAEIIEEQRKKLREKGSVWNEGKIKMQFFSFLFGYADFDKEKIYSMFYETPFSGELIGYSISLVCDGMVAKPYGLDAPSTPYFFFQTFKQGKVKYEDAAGQLLQAMLLAQAKKGDEKPIYGLYVLRGGFTFCILDGTDYSVSKSYDATEIEDLEIILSALVRLKTIIEEELAD